MKGPEKGQNFSGIAFCPRSGNKESDLGTKNQIWQHWWEYLWQKIYTVKQGRLMPIRRFGQRVRCIWRNKELTPKVEDVKLITRWKHVPDTIGLYFLMFFLEFLDESFIIFYVKISQISVSKMAHPSLNIALIFKH